MDRIRQSFVWAVLTNCCLGASALAEQSHAAHAPSASDFQMAMDRAFAQQTSGIPDLLYGDCTTVSQLQCSPAQNGQSRCTYVYKGGKRGVAILERLPNASWRWVSGPYHCAVGIMSK